MKNKWYRREIMERYLTKEEQAEFDARYYEHKIRTLGQVEVERIKNESNS